MLFSTVLSAQTGPELLLKPWPKGEQAQLQGEFTLVNNGSTRSSDDFGIEFYDTSGRIRILTEHRADPRVGWNYTHIHTSGDPALPSQLIDTSIGFGMGIADWNGWLAGITVGVGYAGAGAFDDSNAWYGMADLLVGREIDKTTSFGFALDFDGNRTFMPDVPLPGFLLTKQLDPKLLLGFGFPYSSVEYKPNDQITLSGKIYFPEDLEARIDYSPMTGLGLFAEYRFRSEAFHWDELEPGSDRIIYYSRRAELGARWSPHESVSLILAGGYLFKQEFNVGFDTRDMDRIARPSDEPYVRLAFEVRH